MPKPKGNERRNATIRRGPRNCSTVLLPLICAITARKAQAARRIYKSTVHRRATRLGGRDRLAGSGEVKSLGEVKSPTLFNWTLLLFALLVPVSLHGVQEVAGHGRRLARRSFCRLVTTKLALRP